MALSLKKILLKGMTHSKENASFFYCNIHIVVISTNAYYFNIDNNIRDMIWKAYI